MLEDDKIVKMYLERDESAIYETKYKYDDYLSRISYNILRDIQDCEEVVQDTYLGAWNAIPPTIPQCLKHFLSRITRNLSFDKLDYKLAGKRNAILVELEECTHTETVGNDSLMDEIQLRQLAKVIEKFLDRYDPKEVAMFVDRYYYAYKMSEIAHNYAMTERRVKYLLTKMRGKLREILLSEGYDL